MVKINRHEKGPRVYVMGKRVHHGAVGVGLTVGLIKFKKLRPLCLVGLALIAHDYKDFPWTDSKNH